METAVKKKIKVKWWHILLIIMYCVLATYQILTDRLNERFAGAVEYNPQKGFNCEEIGDFYIMSSEKTLWSLSPLRASITKNNVYYNGNHKTVSISLTVYATRLSGITYLIEFEDWDENKHQYDYSFGGVAYVDSHMNYLYAPKGVPSRREYMEELMNDCKSSIEEICDIANERWKLGLEVND